MPDHPINNDYDAFHRQIEDQADRAGHDDEGQGVAEQRRRDRLADREARLAPLPDLGDVPRPPAGALAESGYHWMEQLPPDWHAEPSWGRDGWDLGAWPLIVVALFVYEEHGRYAVATYTEGDVTANRYRSRGALYVAVNEIAEFHWRLGQSLGPADLPEGQGLLAKHCGPYSPWRHKREAETARSIRADGQEDPEVS